MTSAPVSPLPATALGAVPMPAHDPELARSTTTGAVVGIVAALAASLIHPAAPLAVLALTLALVLSGWHVSRMTAVGFLVLGTLLISGNYRLAVGSPIDLTGIRLAVGVLGLAWLSGQLEVRSDWPAAARSINRPLGWLLAIALGMMLANLGTLAHAGTIGDGLKRLAALAGFVLAYSVTIALVRTRAEVLRVMKLLAIAGAFAALVALAERATGVNPIDTVLRAASFQKYQVTEVMTRAAGLRSYGTAGHPIEFGAIMAMLLPVSACLVFQVRSAEQKFLFSLTTAALAAGMLAAVSRSSLIASVAGVLVLALLSKPSRGLAIAGTAALAGLVVMRQFPGITRTLERMLDPKWIRHEEAAAYSGRMEDWPVVWKMVQTSPLIGVGYDLFDAKANFFLDNQYLKFVIELGVLGLAAAVWLFGAIAALGVRLSLKVRALEPVSPEAALTASSVSFALLGALFDTFGFFQVTTLFFIIAGLLVVLAAPQAAPMSAPLRPAVPSSV